MPETLKQNEICTFPLGDKSVLWFSEENKYVLTEPGAEQIIRMIWEEQDSHLVLPFLELKFSINKEEAQLMADDLYNYLKRTIRNTPLKKNTNKELLDLYFNEQAKPLKRTYNINNIVFQVEYGSKAAEQMNHPKFAHFETTNSNMADFRMQVFHIKDWFVLITNDVEIGRWKESENHFLTGKFSMEILQKIYNRKEKEWLGVFHAAGISDGNNCIMFFGGSGNGKSTLAALLMANGLDVLSDDFLPVTSNPELMCRFPAALSIKKSAYQLVSSNYNELKQAEEHYDPLQDKTFRYLPPLNTQKTSIPCKAIIHVKYQKGAGLNLEEMPHEEAFQHLVPDSWISPEPDNARRFVQWFNQLPCYRLTYSDNTKMVEKVKNLFDNGLS